MLLFCDCATAAFWFHCCSNVHAWPWALKGTKEAQSLPEKSCVASLPPQGSIAMVRVGELGPILKPNGSTTQLISIEAPPLNLLEASSRRASRHTLALDVKDSDLPRLFTDLYVKAIREKDIQWAVKPEVVNLFSENPSMVSQDKQSFHGLEAVTGRLNKGIGTLVKMAGKDAQIPEFSTEGPNQKGERDWEVLYIVHWGAMKYSWATEFTVEKGKILMMRSARK